MNVTVIGVGYVGLVTGACLADMGNHVVCVDIDDSKIALLNSGGIPIHEPGLGDLVRRNAAAGRLEFTTAFDKAVVHGTILMIAVGTPPAQDGSIDLQWVFAAARGIGEHMNDYKVVVNKSTVPVGTGDAVSETIRMRLAARGSKTTFAVVSNPEFLKEGSAIGDFMRPDRIVVGTDDTHAESLMRALYAPFTRVQDRLLHMDVRSAELTKYAANAMLATRISFMNELALLAERLGVDIERVRHGMGSDSRIGYQFLYSGVGYGGSCFPKDVKALVRSGSEAGVDLRVLRAVESANERQKFVLIEKIEKRFEANLEGKRFALWGLAFKPNTDDMREAPSRVLIAELLRRGATVTAYDPVAMNEARRVLGDRAGLAFAATASDALDGADALVIVTEWKEFRTPDFDHIRRSLRQPLIFDGRNLYEPTLMRELNIEYHGIGRGVGPAVTSRRSSVVSAGSAT